ncbi:M36 family metallopeptidase [uncultured Jatrophihabitans sp.]|uniref:M36 family metallopeptidase n=1 Tax=uncultured Jatrophihabitans sp. TaxID=1610747 RepID=UPI0035CB8FCE
MGLSLGRPRSRRRLLAVGVTAIATAGIAASLAGGGAAGAAPVSPSAGGGNLSLLGAPIGFSDLDARVGSVAPTAAQRSAVTALGAAARWNRFGTPESLIKYGGYLSAARSGDAVSVARAWLSSNAALFRLTAANVAALPLLKDQKTAGGAGHAVLFRQKYGSLPAAQDGLIDVSVAGGRVAYVSSSATGPQTAPPAATLTATQAWLRAAANVGRPVTSTALGRPVSSGGWTTFSATGFAQPQRARLVAVPTPGGAARPAYESIVLDVQSAHAQAYTVFVDAVSGAILMRYNRVQESQSSSQFTADFTPSACGAPVPGGTVDAQTKQLTLAATSTIVTNDIALKLLHNGVVVAASSDTGVGQEELTYAPSGGVPAGDYMVQVCPSPAPAGPFVAPYTASGVFLSSNTAAPGGGAPSVPYPPKWKYFYNAPSLDYSSTDTRKTGCWVTTNQTGCDRKEQNLASRSPWDVDVATGLPTFTTAGNNAITGEAWFSPLTPGGVQRPIAADRNYSFAWNDQWNDSKCDPTSFAPTANRNDIDASVTNLFSGHNRFHDFSYYLGFTEDNYNAQVTNFGNGGQGGDPELGDVQAGAVDGGTPSYEGRDNANQIALNDGIPGITNQYLFQPISGSFYAACSDGDFDTTVFGHEYTHLISNRMVGGPDDGLTGAQAGSMGESWSDLDALEYLHEFGYTPQNGENPWAEGPYVTGNKTRGIRNYPLNANPLNYSDIGYDLTGAEVHADGEVWNAVNYDIRQAFVAKYNASYPESNTTTQVRCAQGVLPADQCPGNRRWLQLMYDGWLLQPASDSMLDARDSYLAADVMRFGGANQALLWTAFAKRGFGKNAATNGTDDTDPKPSFVGQTGSHAGTISFTVSAMDQPGQPKVAGAKLYVGVYSAGVTPITTTNSSGVATFTAEPGTYHLVVRKAGLGIKYFTATVTAGATTASALHLITNLASTANGATATGDATSTNVSGLIDDDEGTNWTDTTAAAVNVSHPSVTVHLANTSKGPVPVRSVRVSAFTQQTGGRFDALRHFAIATCTASVTNPGCANPAGFTTIYTSPTNAFPAGLPRPLAPDLTLRSFDVPDTMATHVKLIVLDNQCTGAAVYHGDQDADPLNDSDCVTGSSTTNPLLTPNAPTVKAAELEVFSYDSSTRPPGDPVVAVTATAPATVVSGKTFATTISYSNLGPEPSANAKVVDKLPAGVAYVSGDHGATYDAATRTVTWSLGTVAVTYTGTVHLTLKATGLRGTAVLNQPTVVGDKTVALPGAALTTIT